ncbi:hypothetical protein FIBSPDRAFT_883494 [Athelia psychrophila]|uniref:Uncharacterized protein n=1 Tax=Athelia psychrophila TaxID=1759441 RepID=A0A166U2H7_9AGAM|nr:hypothetical protein FIBSPDRAFT_883494 [Fibularhizoctonia sp. CBS 109695]
MGPAWSGMRTAHGGWVRRLGAWELELGVQMLAGYESRVRGVRSRGCALAGCEHWGMDASASWVRVRPRASTAASGGGCARVRMGGWVQARVGTCVAGCMRGWVTVQAHVLRRGVHGRDARGGVTDAEGGVDAADADEGPTREFVAGGRLEATATTTASTRAVLRILGGTHACGGTRATALGSEGGPRCDRMGWFGSLTACTRSIGAAGTSSAGGAARRDRVGTRFRVERARRRFLRGRPRLLTLWACGQRWERGASRWRDAGAARMLGQRLARAGTCEHGGGMGWSLPAAVLRAASTGAARAAPEVQWGARRYFARWAEMLMKREIGRRE